MKYTIEKRDNFTITGFTKDFHSSDAFLKIPAFLNETTTYINDHQLPIGALCVTINDENDYNLIHYYVGGETTQAIEGSVTYHFKDGYWIKFPCHGPYPFALQRLSYEVYQDFFPNHPEYSIREDISIDYLADGDRNSPDYYSELWLPIKKEGQ